MSKGDVTGFSSVDETRISFLIGIYDVPKAEKSQNIPNGAIPVINTAAEKVELSIAGDPSDDMKDAELESRIQYICDILPDYGPGFIEECIKYYDNDNEKVLNALFD